MKYLSRLVAIVLIVPACVLALAGCATCSDGQSWGGITNLGGYNYSPCGMGCVDGSKKCGCSTACPCWKRHK